MIMFTHLDSLLGGACKRMGLDDQVLDCELAVADNLVPLQVCLCQCACECVQGVRITIARSIDMMLMTQKTVPMQLSMQTA